MEAEKHLDELVKTYFKTSDIHSCVHNKTLTNLLEFCGLKQNDFRCLSQYIADDSRKVLVLLLIWKLRS